MGLSLFLSLLFSSISLNAAVDTILENNQHAYYGAEFYKTFPRQVTKDSLFKILSSSHASRTQDFDSIGTCLSGACYSHVSVGYSEARKILFGKIYVQNEGPKKFVEDVYCGKKFYFRSEEEAANMHTQVNIEHTWPQSKFTTRFNKEMQKSDLHHLYLTDSDANSRRGNHPFGDVPGEEDELNMSDCRLSKLGREADRVTFNPPAHHLGNVARSLFYFSVRYGLELDQKQEATLRKWHKNDPVDANERARHEQIAQKQLNRNPFVDHPELVESISNF
jgi:deoxyribonuclease-1